MIDIDIFTYSFVVLTVKVSKRLTRTLTAQLFMVQVVEMSQVKCLIVLIIVSTL